MIKLFNAVNNAEIFGVWLKVNQVIKNDDKDFLCCRFLQGYSSSSVLYRRLKKR